MQFVSFSGDYWDGPRHNRHYFCEELAAQGHKVLFCSPPFYVVTLIRQLGKGTLSRSGIRRLGANLLNYVPSKLLFTNFRLPWLNRWMAARREATIRRLLRREGIDRPILLLWHPTFRHMIGKFDEALVVYYVYDQYSGYTGGNPNAPDPAEIELLERADLVFVLSKELYAQKARWAKNIHHLPNSVDFDLFSKARDEATPVPDDLAAVPGPRIGYIGTMNEKLDVPLLEHIATARPGWSIVLVGRQNYTPGPERDRFFALVNRPNVHWLGAKPHQMVPAYIKGLDVCMMCYVINGWTFYGDPSKMHEYLASGKPTIAAGLTAIREFSDVISIPDDADGWVTAIEAGLSETGDEMRQRRIETARANSYPYRIRKATALVQDALDARAARR